MLNAGHAQASYSHQELARAWVMQLVERSSLEEVAALPLEWIAGELPPLIESLTSLAGARSGSPELSPRQLGRARALATVAEGRTPSQLCADLAALHSLVLSVLYQHLAQPGPAEYERAAQRLATLFGAVQGAAIDALLGAEPDYAQGDSRELHWRIAQMVEELERGGAAFSVLLIDVDGMRRVNQVGGREEGDRVLAEIAAAIGRELAGTDRLYRLEGDEFCVLAPAESQASPRALAERLNAAIESVQGPRGLRVRATIGLAYCPRDASSADALLDLADIAMYRARAAGTTVADSDPVTPIPS